MKKLIAFFVAPLAALFTVVMVFNGAVLIESIGSLFGVSHAFLELMTGMVHFAPALAIAIVLGFPIFYIMRLVVGWNLWSCLLGAFLVVVLVSLLPWQAPGMDLQDAIYDQYELAILLASVIYGVVFWLIIMRIEEPEED